MAKNLDRITDPKGQEPYEQGGQQTMKFLTKAAAAAGIRLG